jgi:hypothetical protein
VVRSEEMLHEEFTDDKTRCTCSSAGMGRFSVSALQGVAVKRLGKEKYLVKKK